MAKIKKVGDLQIEQDLNFQERMWRIQRVGWVIMALLVLLALLGLFGDGILTRAQEGSPANVAMIDYPRFIRTQTQFSFTIQASQDIIADNKIKVEINDEYLDNFVIEKIIPQPSSEATTTQGKVFEFDVSGEQLSPDITFFLRPETPGPVQAQIELADEMTASFSQFIYP